MLLLTEMALPLPGKLLDCLQILRMLLLSCRTLTSSLTSSTQNQQSSKYNLHQFVIFGQLVQVSYVSLGWQRLVL